jgi:hypothetical protein
MTYPESAEVALVLYPSAGACALHALQPIKGMAMLGCVDCSLAALLYRTNAISAL